MRKESVPVAGLARGAADRSVGQVLCDEGLSMIIRIGHPTSRVVDARIHLACRDPDVPHALILLMSGGGPVLAR